MSNLLYSFKISFKYPFNFNDYFIFDPYCLNFSFKKRKNKDYELKKHIKLKEIDVVAAVLKDKKNFLIAKRGFNQSFPSKWEFPGGKVEKGESFQNALIREIKEELNVTINVLKKIASEDDPKRCVMAPNPR